MTAGRPLGDYRHTVDLQRFPSPPGAADPSFSAWLDSLPPFLAGGDLREVVERWTAARSDGRPAILGMGAHVVKTGLSRWVIRLMDEGLVTHLAVNGAFVIHDFELAAVGHTSEDVAVALEEGVFGRAEETARFLNGAADAARNEGIGLGAALGRACLEAGLPHADDGVLAAAARRGVTVSVHVALGTDTVHAHPSADGAALGAASLADFRLLCDVVAGMSGGVYANVGSAVLLPEVFLKAVSVARAAGHPLEGMTTLVLDFLRHYRPLENVVRRPPGKTGRGFYLVGHHEVMVPLLCQALILARRGR